MSGPRNWLTNWRRFFHRDQADAEQRSELEFYLDATAEEFVARGMDPAAARDAARRKLGSTTWIREEVYQMNTLAFLEGLLRDARHALRMIRRNPGFSSAAILSLALGIGANAAIFSVVNAVLIRALPYPDADALVGVFNSGELRGKTSSDMGFGPGLYAAWKEHSAAFQEFGVWSSGPATVTGNGNPEQIHTVTATQGILPALGIPPLLGRWFSAADDTPGSPETAILSHAYWLRRFGGDAQSPRTPGCDRLGFAPGDRGDAAEFPLPRSVARRSAAATLCRRQPAVLRAVFPFRHGQVEAGHDHRGGEPGPRAHSGPSDAGRLPRLRAGGST